MTNTTITTVNEIVPADNAPTKFADYLIRVNAENTTSETSEEAQRALINRVWAEATKPITAKTPTSTIVEAHTATTDALIERLRIAHTVIGNTLRKMTHGIPDSLLWGVGTTQYYKFRINTIVNNTLHFSYSYGYNGKWSEASIHLRYLNNDPIAVAQMVRIMCRAHANEEYRKAEAVRATQRNTLQTQINQLQNQIKTLEANYAVPGVIFKQIKPTSQKIKAQKAAFKATNVRPTK